MSTGLVNEALADLRFLVGDWEMTISNASFLSDPTQVVTGAAKVEPVEAGMLLALRQYANPSGPPSATWVIGRDHARPEYTVLYTDERGVARVYGMTLADHTWRIARDDPEFAQRFEAAISADGDVVEGRWEKRQASGPWEHDFDIAYRRR